ncbi:hypothetical protein D3C85_1865110 [compost metagenome]
MASGGSTHVTDGRQPGPVFRSHRRRDRFLAARGESSSPGRPAGFPDEYRSPTGGAGA